MSAGRPARRVPAPMLFVIGGLCQYVGAAAAVALFRIADPAVVAWVRCAGAAVILLAWRRPWRLRRTRRALLVAAGFGVFTVGMNIAFYEAVARIPLGTAVAIEFAGPVVVAAVGSRRARDVASLVAVVAGVLLVAGASVEGASGASGHQGLIGVGFALLAAALWAGYVVVGKTVSDGGDGLDSLAVGIAAGTVLFTPVVALGSVSGTVAHAVPTLVLTGLLVGLLSSVVPYALDQVVFARVGRARFAVLLALLPTTATVVGFVALGQLPTPAELAGIALVVVAVILGGGGAGQGGAGQGGAGQGGADRVAPSC